MARRFFIILASVAALLLAALPASANNKPTTGERIHLLVSPPATYLADTAFHIEAGFGCSLQPSHSRTHPYCVGEWISAQSEFDLYVDGVRQSSTIDVEHAYQFGGGFLQKLSLTNFPSGLPAGTHTFRGVWNMRGAEWATVTVTITFA